MLNERERQIEAIRRKIAQIVQSIYDVPVNSASSLESINLASLRNPPCTTGSEAAEKERGGSCEERPPTGREETDDHDTQETNGSLSHYRESH